ncbi:MAG: long-chain fatty acid--CoA ligase [Marinilabiliales bacterium]|nr:MAG: long-chain fatty acid--CoA ligase [Marinilabiliales bacterium]
MTEVRRIFDLLDYIQEKYPTNDDAFAFKKDGEWKKFSTKEFVSLCNDLSLGLLNLALNKGDKVATIANNRPEWNIVDHALLQAGLIHVPIYPTISIDDYRYILKHSEAKMVFVSDKLLLDKLRPILEEADNIDTIYTFNDIDGENNWMEIVELGRKNKDIFAQELKKIKDSISEEELASIIYTSGTTGVQKGVMLSHRNLVSNFIATSDLQPMDSSCKALSFLPLCHVYERMMNYQFQYLGISIYYAENMGKIVDNLKEIKPDGFNTVPRLLERFYDKIIEKGNDLSGYKKAMFFWAVKLGLKYQEGATNGGFYRFKLSIARKLVFKKWKEAMGGNIRIIVTGGSAVQKRLQRIFWAAEIPIVEGYGLTEASPVIAVSHFKYPNHRFGTVGPVLKGVELKFAQDGEIICKGPNVMMGYFKNPEATKEVIDQDGWLHTGDIGVLVDNKFVKITDRKKEIFKISSGKYVAPQPIENKLKESFFIEQAMVIGENEKFASALISPNFSALHDWCSSYKLHFKDNSEIIQRQEVIARFQKEIAICNKTLGQTEQIKRFRLVPDVWSPETGDLSPSLKLKRKVIFSKYEDIIREIYNYAEGETTKVVQKTE